MMTTRAVRTEKILETADGRGVRRDGGGAESIVLGKGAHELGPGDLVLAEEAGLPELGAVRVRYGVLDQHHLQPREDLIERGSKGKKKQKKKNAVGEPIIA
jgi:hypothetical protein